MRNGHIQQQKVDQVTTRIAGSASVLRAYGIDPSSRLTLSQAASATSTSVDELSAVLEYRMRRQARQAQRAAREEMFEEEAVA